jgi:hypothetical protein
MKELNRRCNQSKLLLNDGGWYYLILLHDLAASAESTAGCAWNEFILALDGRMSGLDPVQRKRDAN